MTRTTSNNSFAISARAFGSSSRSASSNCSRIALLQPQLWCRVTLRPQCTTMHHTFAIAPTLAARQLALSREERRTTDHPAASRNQSRHQSGRCQPRPQPQLARGSDPAKVARRSPAPAHQITLPISAGPATSADMKPFLLVTLIGTALVLAGDTNSPAVNINHEQTSPRLPRIHRPEGRICPFDRQEGCLPRQWAQRRSAP